MQFNAKASPKYSLQFFSESLGIFHFGPPLPAGNTSIYLIVVMNDDVNYEIINYLNCTVARYY